jgi:hypothetical protein
MGQKEAKKREKGDESEKYKHDKSIYDRNYKRRKLAREDSLCH